MRQRMRPSAILVRRKEAQFGPMMGADMAARWARVGLPHKQGISGPHRGRNLVSDAPARSRWNAYVVRVGP